MSGITEINSPAAWQANDMPAATHWRRHLKASEIEEIDAGLRHAKSVGGALGNLTKDQFPLPTVSNLLADMREKLETGPGIDLLKGFPVDRYTMEELRLIYWGLAVHLGMPVEQSKYGDLLGDVRDMGVDEKSHGGRGYTSSGNLTFHSDAADVTGLFCLQTAQQGGGSLIASSVAIHNRIARDRPDLLAVLYQPYCWSWRGQNKPDDPTFYTQPVYGQRDGHFVSRYLRSTIDFSREEPGATPQTAQQVEALDYLDSVIADPEFYFEMMFEPGDIQFVNNHVIYHARREFDDDPSTKRHRHLLRLWLSMPNSRPLPASFGALYRDQSAGAVRGGYPGHAAENLYETPEMAH